MIFLQDLEAQPENQSRAVENKYLEIHRSSNHCSDLFVEVQHSKFDYSLNKGVSTLEMPA